MSANLEAAARALVHTPALEAKVYDAIGGVRRLPFTDELYSGSEADADHGAGCCSDGSLIRAYRQASNRVDYQRITSPDAGDAWSTWSNWSLTSGSLCDANARATYGIVVADDTGNTVKERSSSDSGATWAGSWTTIVTLGAAPSTLACAQKSNGDAACFYGGGGFLIAHKRTAGVWGAGSFSGASFSSITGIGATHDGSDWAVVVTGTDSTGRPAVWTLRWGDGGSLSLGAWETIRILRDADLNVSYRAPSIVVADQLRITFVERYTGTGSYTLNLITHDLSAATWAQNLVKEPWPLPTTYTEGMALAYDSTNAIAYLSHPKRVFKSALPSASGADYSSRVIEAEWLHGDDIGRARVVLDNSDGALAGVITLGSELRMDAGFLISGTPTYPTGGVPWTYWLDRVTVIDERNGRSVVEIEGFDGFGLLRVWVARRQIVYSGYTVSAIVTDLCRMAGILFHALGASSELTSITPSFTVPAGQDGLTAVLRALALVKDSPRPYPGGIQTYYPQTSDSSTWTYRMGDASPSASEQPIVSYHRRDTPAFPGFARVIAGSAGSIVGQSQVDATLRAWEGSVRVVVDKGSTSAAEAGVRALAITRDGQLESRADRLESGVNPGTQIGDVVTVHVARASLSGVTRRVRKWEGFYSRNARRYDQRLTLSDV